MKRIFFVLFLNLFCSAVLNAQYEECLTVAPSNANDRAVFNGYGSTLLLPQYIPSQIVNIKVKFRMILAANGTGGIPVSKVSQMLSKVNQFIQNARIQMVSQGIDTIYSDQLNTLNYTDSYLVWQYDQGAVQNIYSAKK